MARHLQQAVAGDMPSISRIVCAVDFSDFSAHAVDYAIALGRHYAAQVTALHVLTPIAPAVASIDAPAVGPFAYGAADMTAVRDELAAFVRRGRALRPVDVEVVQGSAVAEILMLAERLPADLLLLGTHGRSGFERLFLGSVAERVLAKARCPVMTIPQSAPLQLPDTGLPFRHILCAVDFSPASLAAAELASSFARDAGARLTLVNVVEPVPAVEPAIFAGPALAAYEVSATQNAREWIQEIAPTDLVTAGTARTLVTTGKAHREILRLAREQGGDLIVMGAHAGVAGALGFGSTTNHVVRRAHCPVLSARA